MPPYYQSADSLLIQAPAEKIYEALTNWTLRSQWRRGIKITWEGDSKAFVGQQVTFQVQHSFSSYSFSFRITGLEPPHRLYMEYFGKPLQGRAALEVTPRETGCLVTFHWMKVEPVGWAARLFFALGFGLPGHRQRTQETLQMLKEYLEKPRS